VGIHYPVPIHLLPAFAPLVDGKPGQYPHAERHARRILSLPIYPGLPPAAQDRVVSELRRSLGRG
jgi:dTDP-4-amino-4,6-dideoxygalactose transaminase